MGFDTSMGSSETLMGTTLPFPRAGDVLAGTIPQTPTLEQQRMLSPVAASEWGCSICAQGGETGAVTPSPVL